MHFLIMIPDLRMGGAEKIAAMLANHWAANGEKVTLCMLCDPTTESHYPLHEHVRINHLSIYGTPSSSWQRLKGAVGRHARIRKAVRDSGADVVVSITDMTNVRVLLSTIGLRIPVIVCEHTDPLRHDIGKTWRWLREKIYRRCSALTVLTPEMRDYFTSFTPPGKVHVMPNPIELPDIAPQEKREREIIYVGRFSPEKRVDVLLDAFSGIQDKEWSLVLIGDGPLRQELEQIAHDLGIAERVTFTGTVDSPYPHLAKGGIFALPSLYEGLPNALAEAMIMGMACLATETSGARGLIRHEHNGLLAPVDSPRDFAAALSRLTSDDRLRQRLGKQAMEIRKTHSTEAVMRQWAAMLENLPGLCKGQREAGRAR